MMYSEKIAFFGLLVVLLVGCMSSTQTPNSQVFEEVGANSATTLGISGHGDARYPSIAISPNNDLYIAWEHRSVGLADSNGTIKVKFWNGEKWFNISSGLINDFEIENTKQKLIKPQIAFAPNGILYIAWLQNNNIYMKQWDGKIWQNVGINSAIGNGISQMETGVKEFSLVVAPNNTVYVSWRSVDSKLSTVYVKQWQNGDWVDLRTQPQIPLNFTSNPADIIDTELDINSEGVLYSLIVSNDQNNIKNVYVQRWYDNKWELIGEPINIKPSHNGTPLHSEIPSMIIGNNDKVYVVWGDRNKLISVRQLSELSNKWISLDLDLSSFTNILGAPFIAINSDEELYVVWEGTNGIGYGIYSAKFVNNNWQEIFPGSMQQNPGISYTTLPHGNDGSVPMSPLIVTDRNDKIYVVWQIVPSLDDRFKNNKLYIRQYEA